MTVPNQKDCVAAAMNAHGFLLQENVLGSLTNGASNDAHKWVFHAAEYPVTTANGKQRKLDIVLQNSVNRDWYAILECKRAHPDYAAWVFFGQDQMVRKDSQRSMQVEKWRNVDPPRRVYEKRFLPIHGTCLTIRNFYIEAKLDKVEAKSNRETIENAFTQSIEGQSGVMTKLSEFRIPSFVVVPVVVTTAQILAANYELTAVDVERGTIEPAELKLESLEMIAVNFHASDDLSIYSGERENMDLWKDVRRFQLRTIFVCRADTIVKSMNTITNVLESA